MGKLGKKAGKFAEKNLQSVLKRKMKVKSFFKKKTAKIFGEDDSDMDRMIRIVTDIYLRMQAVHIMVKLKVRII
ncbi:hypothetical protein NC651_025538 [Populus alba x Populus x berolinensis]|nr:hypothetical protein NC651_025538 [Populus alba x Populus x berolinensis]